jgi:hypothetical protein
MAGVLKVDSINADSNLSFRIANTAVAFIDSNGLRPVSGNLSLDSTGTTGVRSPAANTLVFYEGGVEAVRIDSAGIVGIGAIPYTWWSASKALQVGTTTAFEDLSAGTTIFNNSYRDAGGSSVYATTAAASRYTFSGNQHSLQGAASGTVNTTVSWTPLVAVELGKSVALQGASSQTGTGITFPATQSASSDANTLDDYEEGTWTPVFSTGSSQPGSLTYVNRGGNYTKIGRYVIAWFYMNITVSSSGTGNPALTPSSLPFTPASNSLTNSQSSRGGYVTSIPNANGAGAVMTWNNANPASADALYMTNSTCGGSMTQGGFNGVYAGYVMYETST